MTTTDPAPARSLVARRPGPPPVAPARDGRRPRLRPALDPAGWRLRLARRRRTGPPRPAAPPVPHRPDGVGLGRRGPARHPGLGGAARPRDGLPLGAPRRRRARRMADRTRLRHTEVHLRPRPRRPRRRDGAGGRSPRCGAAARAGGRGRRHPPLGRVDPDPAGVVRRRLVRPRGVPGGQRQHARGRGLHRHGSRHGRRASGTSAPSTSPTASSTGRPGPTAGCCPSTSRRRGTSSPSTTATTRSTRSAPSARPSATRSSGPASSSSSRPHPWWRRPTGCARGRRS